MVRGGHMAPSACERARTWRPYFRGKKIPGRYARGEGNLVEANLRTEAAAENPGEAREPGSEQ